MAFIVKGKQSSWEIRESHATVAGPRSTTLASFKRLDDEVIARAESRAGHRLDRMALEQAARRAGAPVALPESERSARELLAAVNQGERPSPGLAKLIADSLSNASSQLSDAAQAASAWVGVSERDRAAALVDLLLLSDALPAPDISLRPRFPRIPLAQS